MMYRYTATTTVRFRLRNTFFVHCFFMPSASIAVKRYTPTEPSFSHLESAAVGNGDLALGLARRRSELLDGPDKVLAGLGRLT